jgi:hypothetical protein
MVEQYMRTTLKHRIPVGICTLFIVTGMGACSTKSTSSDGDKKVSSDDILDTSPSSDDDNDTEKDSTSDTFFDTGTEPEIGYACDGECNPADPIYSECTCGVEDPCGWIEDGECDERCISDHVVTEMFDDFEDCTDCQGQCESVVYSPCTCNTFDPCGWGGNGFCDSYCFVYTQLGEIFDDSEDCGVCSGACTLGVRTTCTCGPDDPCGFSNDGWCDDECLTAGYVDEMFDDTEDCK